MNYRPRLIRFTVRCTVTAKADMVDPDQLDHILDMVEIVFERRLFIRLSRPADGRPRRQPHDSSILGEQFDFFVTLVAWIVADLLHIRM
ncbi:hypothetical protein D3C87_1948630 [compost metagenome]